MCIRCVLIIHTVTRQMFSFYVYTADTVLKFFNDSPRVNGSTITADLYFNQPVRSLQCYLTGLPRQDCKSKLL